MYMTMPDYQTLEFKTSAQWRQWLEAHHADTPGVWLQISKKGSGIPSITIAEALDQALCFGWIDGQRNRHNEVSYLQKFTPRRKGSLWSKRNVEYVARLTAAGLMTPAGLTEVERAKADGRWAAAYDKPSEMTVPAEFLAELDKHPRAKQVFATLNKTNTYAIAWRLRTAKTEETRLKRQTKILEMLDAGQELY
jgi:uncharacterized protein YdeI (YjbR/CyaY-like superfamily)